VNTSSPQTSSETVAITYPTGLTKRMGWLKRFSGTCSQDGASIVISVGSVSDSTTCSGGIFEKFVNVETLSAGVYSVSVILTDLTGLSTALQTVTTNKISSACDSSLDRVNDYADSGGRGYKLSGGSGTYSAPWVICTQDQLNEINNNLNGFYVLGNDIDFLNGDSNGDGAENGSDTDYRAGSGWDPIGGTFQGAFNGQFFEVANLKIDRSTTDDVGLFSFIQDGGLIRNLTMRSVDIRGQDYTGAVLGRGSAMWLLNIIVDSGSVIGRTQVGGIIGNSGQNNRARAGIAHVASKNLAVSGDSITGGIIGYLNNTEHGIQFAYSVGSTVTSTETGSTSRAGGIAGVCDD